MSGGTAQKQVRPQVWQQKPSRKVRQTQLFSYTSTNLDSRKESSDENLSSVLHRTQQMKQRGSNTTPEGAFEDQRASNLMLIPLVWVSITGMDTSCLELSCSPWNIWCFRENQFHQIPFKASTVSFFCPETSQKHFCSFIMQTPRSKAPGHEGGIHTLLSVRWQCSPLHHHAHPPPPPPSQITQDGGHPVTPTAQRWTETRNTRNFWQLSLLCPSGGTFLVHTENAARSNCNGRSVTTSCVLHIRHTSTPPATGWGAGSRCEGCSDADALEDL